MSGCSSGPRAASTLRRPAAVMVDWRSNSKERRVVTADVQGYRDFNVCPGRPGPGGFRGLGDRCRSLLCSDDRRRTGCGYPGRVSGRTQDRALAGPGVARAHAIWPGFRPQFGAKPVVVQPECCCRGGWGGSVIIVDQDARRTMSCVMNKMHEGLPRDMRSGNLIAATYRSLPGG
jgi:hypothetical protein